MNYDSALIKFNRNSGDERKIRDYLSIVLSSGFTLSTSLDYMAVSVTSLFMENA